MILCKVFMLAIIFPFSLCAEDISTFLPIHVLPLFLYAFINLIGNSNCYVE